MTSEPFLLQPFESDSYCQKYKIDGALEREKDRLKIAVNLRGPLEELVLLPLNEHPSRRDHLWESTCFEVFIAQPDQNTYWEWNFSSNLDWNLLKFKDYRNLDTVQEKWDHQIKRQDESGLLQLEVTLVLPPRLKDNFLDLGLSYVLEHRNKEYSHWSLRHLSRKPDFHNRGGFEIKI